jgi:hypothetical protein
VPGRPGPVYNRAVPGSDRAQKAGFVLGSRASCLLDIYILGRVCLLAGSGWHIKNYERGFVAIGAWLLGRTPISDLAPPPPNPPVTPIFIFGREPILSSLLNQRRMMAMACRSSSTSSKI